VLKYGLLYHDVTLSEHTGGFVDYKMENIWKEVL